MTNHHEASLACALGTSAYAERLEWIAQLNREGLQRHRLDGASLELHYATAVRDRVRELVRKESECCRFLTFALDETGASVRLTITVPAHARDSAEILLNPFIPPRAAKGQELAPSAAS